MERECGGSGKVPGNCVSTESDSALSRSLVRAASETGGIDFTSLELRFLAERSGQVEYASKATSDQGPRSRSRT
ncbi:hypothetical protein DFJ64_0925 [Thermasporomyces composti]|jgi:hypothetical protein|uniref:Uncharacterized protein n=1 Tax=Thermasporomyces composti TaxID=696763 RepID=A0A3D9VBK4_THECX|nr:hypothetical protein DFJ64_0925 [Thermasporomyces composti]